MTPDWYDDAACRDQAPMFDAHIDGEEYPQESARHTEAKAICARCPVLDDCKAETKPSLHGGTIRAGKVLARPQAPTPGAQLLEREHGTQRGWRQHIDRGDKPPCQPCRTAHIAYESKQRRQKREREALAARLVDGRGEANAKRANPREHGTERGYQQHYRRKDDVCQPCKDAHAEVKRARRKAA